MNQNYERKNCSETFLSSREKNPFMERVDGGGWGRAEGRGRKERGKDDGGGGSRKTWTNRQQEAF